MSDAYAEYYREAVELAFDGCGLWDAIKDIPAATMLEIGAAIAESVENQSLAIYSPPASDRLASLEREWRQRVEDERDRTEAARKGAETAVRNILRIHRDVPLSVTDGGEVYRSDGRMERVA